MAESPFSTCNIQHSVRDILTDWLVSCDTAHIYFAGFFGHRLLLLRASKGGGYRHFEKSQNPAWIHEKSKNPAWIHEKSQNPGVDP